MGYEGETHNGNKVIKSPAQAQQSGSNQVIPAEVAWQRLLQASNNLENMDRYFPETLSKTEDIKSTDFIARGLCMWWGAMGSQLGLMASLPFPQLDSIREKIQVLKEHFSSPHQSQELKTYMMKLLECPVIEGDEFSGFLDALTFLSGQHIMLEMGGGKIVPSPSWLKFCLPQQLIAVLMCITNARGRCTTILGNTMVLPPSILEADDVFFSNIGKQFRPNGEIGKEGTPQQVIDYIKNLLRKGMKWDGAVRPFVSMVYRGTVFFAWFMASMGALPVAVRHYKWARSFITLADNEWNVSKSDDYKEKGSCFRSSFQINIFCMELETARSIRPPTELPSLQDAVYEFGLAQSIIKMAKEQTPYTGSAYKDIVFDFAFRRKPLMLAHRYCAGTLNALIEDQALLMKVVEATGIHDVNADPPLFCTIAEHYKQAAIANLDDDSETPILWWGHAAHMCQAGRSTLGELRQAINSAVSATEKHDIELFGPQLWKGKIIL